MSVKFSGPRNILVGLNTGVGNRYLGRKAVLLFTGLAHESCGLNASRDGGTQSLQTQKPKHMAFCSKYEI